MRHDVLAHVGAQPLVRVAVRRDLGDDQLHRLVGEVVQSLSQRLAERDDRKLGVHATKSLLVGDCRRHTTSPAGSWGCGPSAAEALCGDSYALSTTPRRTMRENETSNGAPSRIRQDDRCRTIGAGRDADRGVRRAARPGSSRRDRRSRSGPAWRATRAAWRHARPASPPSCARAATGRSKLEPAKGDRRFSDPAWEGNWLLRRLLQGYLAVGETVDGLISDADVDWRAERRARLAAGNVLDALAPDELPVVKPDRAEGDGQHRRRQPRARRRAGSPSDLSTPPRLPATVDTSKFEVGGNLAATPGLGRAAHRGVRADPVQAARPRRCARCRCCSSRRRSTSTTSSTSRPAAA